MASTSHQVIALFAEPLFKANIASAISAEQIDFIKKLKMRDNIENLISENKYIFEEPQLKSIKDAVQEVLDIYAAQVMCIPQRLYVTQSWSLINKSNAGMHDHAHSNSIISGSLYYCELPQPAAPARQAQCLQHAHHLGDAGAERNPPVSFVSDTQCRFECDRPDPLFDRLQHLRQGQAGRLSHRVGAGPLGTPPPEKQKAPS